MNWLPALLTTTILMPMNGNCLCKCVGYSPHYLFTSTAPAAHAVHKCFGKEIKHFWCLWHMGKNLVEKQRPKDVTFSTVQTPLICFCGNFAAYFSVDSCVNLLAFPLMLPGDPLIGTYIICIWTSFAGLSRNMTQRCQLF